jgi:dTDP-4-amino-4,6-dideoxy-D-galactose acyltransferase
VNPASVKPGEDCEPLCTRLDWDSRFFERRIAQVNGHRLDEVKLSEILAWCKTNRIDCLYFLADSNDAQTSALAEQNGFRLTDVRLTFERTLSESPSPVSPGNRVRLARPADLGALKAIARTGHRDTRFYFDLHFEREKCDLLYETWIENSFNGFAQAVLVAEINAEPVGYITCRLQGVESRVGLVGVAGKYQGMGFGKQLVEAFLAWSAEHGARRATVVTQGRNIGAQRLYQRMGFLTATAQLWYHRWFLG